MMRGMMAHWRKVGWARRGRFVAMMVMLACTSDGPNAPDAPPPLIATAAELGALVGALAHDSLRGRRASSPEDQLVTQFVATRAASYGLAAGAGAGFFHPVPGEWRSVGTASVFVGDNSLAPWTDAVPLLPRTAAPTLTWDAPAVYAGTFVSSTQPLPSGVDIAGRAVVMDVAPGGPVLVSLAPDNPLAQSAVVFLVAPVPITGELLALAQARRLLAGAALRSTAAAPVVLMVTRDVAEQLLGQSLVGMQPGHAGGRTRGEIAIVTEPAPMRNVVALLPGTDPALADEYVVLGAHLDHVGVRQGAGADSIYNGADDNASGSAALLMVARHFSDAARRPRRPLLFIWFAAEELGLIGSEAFSYAPTIPLRGISAFVNLDMVSRGGAADIPGGGPRYLQSIGSRRSSNALGAIVDSIAGAHDMQLDYAFDASGHPERVFCRSDQWNFARFGIPVVFFTTGVHAEYHTVDDEVDRSDFDKLARVTTLVAGVVDAIASRPAQLTRDLPAPGLNAVCQQ
jgi:hypothetical protein